MENFPLVDINKIPTSDKWRFSTVVKESLLDGKNLLWSVGFDGKNLIMKHGFQGGVMQYAEREVLPKAGRSLCQQAHQEARKRLIDKLREGYSSVSTMGASYVCSKAMLASKFKPGETRLNYPVFCQAKLDGVRMLVSRKTPSVGVSDSIYCMSREGNEFAGIDTIKKELKEFIMYLPGSCTIDGELFTKEVSFNKLSGLLRRKKLPEPGEEDYLVLQRMHYNIFDVNLHDSSPFEDRYMVLYDAIQAFIVDNGFPKYLKFVRSHLANNEKEILSLFDKFISFGFEGIIIRKLGGKRTEKEINQSMYKPTRVCNILKYKGDRESEEVLVIGATTGEGKEKDLVIWKVRDIRGNEFTVRPKGTELERRDLLVHKDEYMGKQFTIEYQELSEYGVPRFPVGIGFRDYE